MCTLKDAGIEIGTWLYFQWGPNNISKAVLIGIKPERYVATTYPVPYLLRDTTDLVVFFHNSKSDNLYEFRTRVVKFFDDPIEFLLLEYPERVSLREQRNYKRIRCLVSAKIHYTIKDRSETVEGIIKDVSKKGCRLTFSIKKLKEEAFKKNERIVISCKFPGIPSEQRVTGIIRNIVQRDDDLSLGIEFDEFAWWAPPY